MSLLMEKVIITLDMMCIYLDTKLLSPKLGTEGNQWDPVEIMCLYVRLSIILYVCSAVRVVFGDHLCSPLSLN